MQNLPCRINMVLLLAVIWDLSNKAFPVSWGCFFSTCGAVSLSATLSSPLNQAGSFKKPCHFPKYRDPPLPAGICIKPVPVICWQHTPLTKQVSSSRRVTRSHQPGDTTSHPRLEMQLQTNSPARGTHHILGIPSLSIPKKTIFLVHPESLSPAIKKKFHYYSSFFFKL